MNHISQRAQFLLYLEQQKAELSFKLKHLEYEILKVYEMHEATGKLLEVMKRRREE